MFKEIISLDNLFLAWDEFKKGKRKKKDVQEFEYNLENNIFELHHELKIKIYSHSDYTSFNICDPKPRKIHKACVGDRVLHHAIFRILYPIFDKSFIFDSYSCRNAKGTHKAVSRLQMFARKTSKNRTKTCFILKCDIKKFFNSIDQDILTFLIKKKIKDTNAVWLIEKIIKSFSTLSDKGLPLGNITSQLFANIYLNELDYFIKQNLRIKHYIRYCDDFVILTSDREHLESIISVISEFLKEKLKLSLHKGKVIIKKHHQGIDFLGYVDLPYHRILRTKTKKRMLEKIKLKSLDFDKGKISKDLFNQTLQSYFGVLKHCNGHELKQKISRL
ncbi:reverse transcriptase/maturase family protein [Patescibacteria group bacterium]|nr:reverse transcriptase/maturase family protein [Patescibacteria group bacterium]MBU4367419.1 reverse transcriptase/maturase family protein [Patescibacteria group bacterium]MBU4461739.1 reverse transcriptase/maturase family protein [Patescibacteria group bacterium]MCG2700123.1 reverse transcriptase/maturase family protein [Candidatus Parcubacteria bacterium]